MSTMQHAYVIPPGPPATAECRKGFWKLLCWTKFDESQFCVYVCIYIYVSVCVCVCPPLQIPVIEQKLLWAQGSIRCLWQRTSPTWVERTSAGELSNADATADVKVSCGDMRSLSSSGLNDWHWPSRPTSALPYKVFTNAVRLLECTDTRQLAF